MSDQSNNQGRAYEFICLLTLSQEINKTRKAEIEVNSAYHAAEHAWNTISDELKSILAQSAIAAVSTIFDMEPMIIENSDDILSLKIQTDNEGKEGDVRDIVVARKDVKWEIGLSLKHNHFAVKHSRLAKGLDFGNKWFGIPCSENYWNDIKPIFNYLTEQKADNKKWNELPSKDISVYVPLLQAFITRQREYQLHRENKYLKIECLLKSQARIRVWLFFISTILFFAAGLTFSLIFSMSTEFALYLRFVL